MQIVIINCRKSSGRVWICTLSCMLNIKEYRSYSGRHVTGGMPRHVSVFYGCDPLKAAGRRSARSLWQLRRSSFAARPKPMGATRLWERSAFTGAGGMIPFCIVTAAENQQESTSSRQCGGGTQKIPALVPWWKEDRAKRSCPFGRSGRRLIQSAAAAEGPTATG